MSGKKSSSIVVATMGNNAKYNELNRPKGLRKYGCPRRQRRDDNNGYVSVYSINSNYKRLLNENLKEDAVIAQLEKNLKLKKSSSYIDKSLCDDGLDYLLETCEKVTTSTGSKKQSSDSSSDSDLPSKRLRAALFEEMPSPCSSSSGSTESKVEKININLADFSIESTHTSLENDRLKKDVDIVAEGVDGTNHEVSSDELFTSLKRQVKGSLNRLAEANMHKIAVQLESLYLSNSRNFVNNILLEVVLDSLVTSVRTPERLVLETSMLLAVLHANVDMSVGAKMVHGVAQLFSTVFKDASDDCKKLDNLVLLIAFLYDYKVIGEVFIYDIINIFTERFSIKDVELILLLLRIVGTSLRKNNSFPLKDLIHKIQMKATAAKELENGSRAEYMLDILLAIKNNNIQKIPNYDCEHLEHMKKMMKSFLHPGCCVTPINMTIGDIIKVGEQGILRCSASGQLLEENVKSTEGESKMSAAEPFAKLANAYRINTDVRRSIFTILVTSEDYIDAFEKILQHQTMSQQDYEVMNLIVHCSIQERAYNPYYQYLACRLCHINRKYMVSLQRCVWDKLEEIDKLKNNQVSNLASFVGFCIIDKGLPLASLKMMDFSMLNEQITDFLKEVLLIILTKSSLETYQLICKTITSPKHNVFRESLWLYVKHIFKTSDVVNDKTGFNCIKQRVEMMSKIFGYS